MNVLLLREKASPHAHQTVFPFLQNCGNRIPITKEFCPKNHYATPPNIEIAIEGPIFVGKKKCLMGIWGPKKGKETAFYLGSNMNSNLKKIVTKFTKKKLYSPP